MKRHLEHSNSYKEIHLLGAGLQFSGLVRYCYSGKHSCSQTNMVLERKLRVLHLDLQAAAGREEICARLVIQVLQGHIYSNKATCPNSATPYFQVMDSMNLLKLFLFKPLYFTYYLELRLQALSYKQGRDRTHCFLLVKPVFF